MFKRRGFMLISIAASLMLASAPAFASDHIQVNPDFGIIGGALFYVYQEIIHLFNHTQAFLLALSTGSWQMFQAANICADQAVLTKIFFTQGGWVSMIAMFALWQFRHALLRSLTQPCTQLARI